MSLESVLKSPVSVDRGYIPVPVRTQSADEPASVSRLEQALETLERQLILEALRRTAGNQSKAARDLGITDRIMGLRVKKYQIDARSFQVGRTSSNSGGTFPWQEA